MGEFILALDTVASAAALNFTQRNVTSLLESFVVKSGRAKFYYGTTLGAINRPSRFRRPRSVRRRRPSR